MTHLDEGTILAVRDEAWEAEDAFQHLSACTPCSGELAQARARAAQVAEALSVLDDDVEVESAKAAVRRRLDAAHGAPPRGALAWPALGKAAALVLLAAGAASALPGSPLRNWWSPTTEPTPASSPTGPSVAAQDAPVGGIAVPVDDGRIAVIVRGVAAGTSLEVVWGDEASARVSAPAGSDFTYAGGRAEVDVAAGPVRVELPRGAQLATLEVDGVEYVRRSGAFVDVAGPAVERTDARILFVAPER